MDTALTLEQLAAEHEALLQFLYLAPIGLIQARTSGEIVFINPLCARLLLPLSGGLDNLFDALEPLEPGLAARVAGFTARHGVVCEAWPLPAAPGVPPLSLSIVKLEGDRLMAVLSPLGAVGTGAVS